MEEDDQAPNWRSWVPSNGAGHSAVAQRALAGLGSLGKVPLPRWPIRGAEEAVQAKEI